MLCPPNPQCVPLWLVRESDLPAWRGGLTAAQQRWVDLHGYTAERHRVLVLPGEGGELAGVALGVGKLGDWSSLTHWHSAGLVDRVPTADYRLATELPPGAARHAAFGWCYGAYRARRNADSRAARPRLAVPDPVDRKALEREVHAITTARDLINAGANDLGPAELADAVAKLAATYGAQYSCITGEALLAANYPLVHAVGRGSPRAPRLIDVQWGAEHHPKVTLVGKGVCFDSGGLDLKSSTAMALMKKDMGGAAVAIAIAQSLMARRAPVRLRLLIPAVENAVDGHAFRPGDVLRSRHGSTIEIGNTDAEGRLVLADALAEADSTQPDLLLDFATLTGAARVALGPELPAVFGTDATLVERARTIGNALADPVWPLPLWDAYDEDLGSRVADLNNVAPNAFAGAIYGALFLRRFVSRTPQWLHFDLYAWNARERPGRPVGAEAQCVRLVDELLRERYG